MQLTGIVRGAPDPVGAIFAPVLPAKVSVGDGRTPCRHRECLHGLSYVRITGRGWEYRPSFTFRLMVSVPLAIG